MNIKLKSLLLALKQTVAKDENQQKLIDEIIKELGAELGIKPEKYLATATKKSWAHKTARILSKIGVELLKHGLTEETLKYLKEFFKYLKAYLDSSL